MGAVMEEFERLSLQFFGFITLLIVILIFLLVVWEILVQEGWANMWIKVMSTDRWLTAQEIHEAYERKVRKKVSGLFLFAHLDHLAEEGLVEKKFDKEVFPGGREVYKMRFRLTSRGAFERMRK